MPCSPARADDAERFANPIPHLLLVAGPSGGGKTTFITQLVEGTLAPEIHGRLPERTAAWDRIEGNRFVKRGTKPVFSPGGTIAHRGLILHYDIVHLYRSEVRSYEEDPAFELVEAAETVTIVNLRPSHHQLLAQFAFRAGETGRRKGLLRGVFKGAILLPLRRLRFRLKGRRVPDKRDLYADPAWLTECIRRWDTFVQGLIARTPGATLIEVVPIVDSEGRPSFRLARDGNRRGDQKA